MSTIGKSSINNLVYRQQPSKGPTHCLPEISVQCFEIDISLVVICPYGLAHKGVGDVYAVF